MWLLPACGDPTGPETEIAGAQLYMQYCARCHGAGGGGLPEANAASPDSPEFLAAQKPLDDPARARQLSDEHIMGVIRGGRVVGGRQVMPAFADEFTEAKLMVLAAYVRSLSGTQAERAPSQ